MSTARAVVVTEPGDSSVLKVLEWEVAEPRPGEVQVEVAAAGVNFFDVYVRQGVYPTPTPFVLGNEGAGTVAAVGEGVTGFSVGDRVAWAQSGSSQATRVNVPATRLVAVPEGVSLTDAAAAMLQGLTAHYLVTSTYPVREGDVALVHAAAGGVGQLLVQLIASRGGTVVATAGSETKLRIARERGAHHTINYSEVDDLAAAVREIEPAGVEVVYDGVGKATFDASLASLKRRGMLVLFGGASGQVPPFDLQRLNSGGSLYVTRPTLGDYVAERGEFERRAAELFEWLRTGEVKLDIGGQYTFDQAAHAYDALEGRRTTGKLILVP
ncbi:quinone oxidoreductase [Tessaracoccus sp. OS52]|uniref:quinone oxidoreductase family protein n=1 Tax=Tessaracoccus sp. OS52 TaxID=2886691 RepID=UPI001D110C00|nr:quinone oxidoreductase [Tessaracoccus sp. OS52]MCC2592261.1 quinone oxidoreductase [Tessaracoccus sp. OS52]